jgi:hypothetical protein
LLVPFPLICASAPPPPAFRTLPRPSLRHPPHPLPTPPPPTPSLLFTRRSRTFLPPSACTTLQEEVACRLLTTWARRRSASNATEVATMLHAAADALCSHRRWQDRKWMAAAGQAQAGRGRIRCRRVRWGWVSDPTDGRGGPSIESRGHQVSLAN